MIKRLAGFSFLLMAITQHVYASYDKSLPFRKARGGSYPVDQKIGRLFPDFMSVEMAPLDTAILNWIKDEMAALDANQRKLFLNVLSSIRIKNSLPRNAKANHARKRSPFTGLLVSQISLKSGLVKARRLHLVHELQHAIDFMKRPEMFWSGYGRTIRVELSAFKAERKVLSMAYSADELKQIAHVSRKKLDRLRDRRLSLLPNRWQYWLMHLTDLDLDSRGKMEHLSNYKQRMLDEISWERSIRERGIMGEEAGALSHLIDYAPKIAMSWIFHPFTLLTAAVVVLACEIKLLL